MSGVMKPYIVRQGDYLAKLAFVHGFDAETVWGDAKNEDLKKLRPDPNILAPGDILYIPDKGEEPLAIEKGVENSYAAEVPKVDIGFALRRGEAVLGNEPYVIHGVGTRVEGTSDGDGQVHVQVPVHVREIQVVLPEKTLIFPVTIGDMDPVSESSGLKKRLANLGYLDRLRSGAEDADGEEALRKAIGSFQSARGLPDTGLPDAITLDEVVRAHGC